MDSVVPVAVEGSSNSMHTCEFFIAGFELYYECSSRQGQFNELNPAEPGTEVLIFPLIFHLIFHLISSYYLGAREIR